MEHFPLTLLLVVLKRDNLGDDLKDEFKEGLVDFFVVKSPDLVADNKRDFVCKFEVFSVTGFAVSVFARVVV